MNVVTGALGSLLPMLGELLKDEFKLQTGVKKDIESVQRELGSMNAALCKVADVPRDQLDEQVRHWADEVREMSYDADDIVDTFLVRVVGHQLKEHSCFKRLLEKMANLFKKAKARRQIAIAIRDIKAQVQDVAARRNRYKLDGVGANSPASTPTTIDPRLLSLYKENKEIVGIQEPMDNIIKRLTDGHGDDHVSKCQLKIISIFGPGGMGKTTLAKAVYDRLQWQFVRRSFVSVGRNPDAKKVLKDILLQLDKEKYMNSNMAIFDERQLIDEVRGLLDSER
nr:unnamed protein product [Digitaria exilis]